MCLGICPHTKHRADTFSNHWAQISSTLWDSTGGSVSIQNTVVQSVELQGNRGGTGKSRQNSSGTKLVKFAGAASLMTVQVTTNTGVASVMTVQLNPINPNGPILPETLESYGGGPNGPHFYCLFFTWSLGHLGSVWTPLFDRPKRGRAPIPKTLTRSLGVTLLSRLLGESL